MNNGNNENMGLGETAAANESLRYLELMRCPQLEDLSALDQVTGLTQLKIYDCDKLTEPLVIEQNSSPGYISVYGCENLADRRVR